MLDGFLFAPPPPPATDKASESRIALDFPFGMGIPKIASPHSAGAPRQPAVGGSLSPINVGEGLTRLVPLPHDHKL
jgi:hypothetical protein